MSFKPTPEQDKAILHCKGNLQIIACAGSGKTEVVSRRIAELVKKGAVPKSIVAFTFTEKAADELKARIREIIDRYCPSKADLGDMYIGTIHSFCFEMLKQIEPRYRGYDVLDDARRVAFISMPHRYYSSHLRTLEEHGKFKTIEKFLQSYDIVRMEDIAIDDLSNTDFAECCRRYEGFLEEDRYLDFAAMIYRLVKILEQNKEAKQALNDRIKHLVVDEYQDVDQLQEELIRYIANGCESLCVVGDDDQCIYNWRGSTVENIVDFSNNYPNVTMVPIPHNFRSTGRIIDCATRFISGNQRRLSKDMKPWEPPINLSEEGDLFYRHFDTEEEEFNFIVDRIHALIGTDLRDKKGTAFSLSYGDFAILTRYTKEAAKIAAYLEAANIDFVLDVGAGIFDRPEVVLALSCLAYYFDFPLQEKPVKESELVQLYSRVFINATDEKGNPLYPNAKASSFINSIRDIKTAVQKIASKGTNDYLQLGLQPYLHETLQAFGADRFEFEDVYNYNFAVLSQAIADYESVWRRLRASEAKYFFAFVINYGAGSYADTSHNNPSLINAVKLLTIHRAKGLEFPVVFLPGIVKDRTHRPQETFVDDNLYDRARYDGDVEDERRVYYTAITRSMKYFFMTGSTRRHKEDGSEYVHGFDPHPFVYELTKQTKFSNDTDIRRKKSGFEKRKLGSNLFPTSFSDLSCYRRCGHDYRLRGIYGYEVVLPPVYGYGVRLHNILNIIYQNYIKSKKIPDETDIDNLFKKHFFLRYATDTIIDAARVGGTRVIKNYVKLNQQDFSKILETEKKFELVEKDALITGQIDLLKKYDEHGNLNEVEIVDFKSEKGDKPLYGTDYELQLRLYAIACLRVLGLHPKKAVIHHLDDGKKDEVGITEPELSQASATMDYAISNIVDGHFQPKPSASCKECDWARICSHKPK
jgi:DNA helicase-2/ATP-dependent DNA helicase PcrA